MLFAKLLTSAKIKNMELEIKNQEFVFEHLSDDPFKYLGKMNGKELKQLSVSDTNKYYWECPSHHIIYVTPKYLMNIKSKGCSYCNQLKIPTYNLSESVVLDPSAYKLDVGKLDFNLLWGDQMDREYKQADGQMYSSIIDRNVMSIVLRTLEKNKSLKTLPDKLETQEEMYQSKVDLSQTALKRFEKSLDSSKPHWYKRNMEILSEIKFVGQFSLADKWHTFIVWKHITDPKIIRKFVPNYDPSLDENYISAVVYPRGNENPISKFYKTTLSDAELKEAPLQSSAFDKQQFGINPTEKVIMTQFDHAEGLSWNFNDEEYGIGEFSLLKKHRVEVNSIQQRFAYVRQHLCGISQNSLARELGNKQGINIDQKGIKYWETHPTDYPSFLKNHWDDVLDTLTELSYELLNTPMKMSLNEKFEFAPAIEDMDFNSVRMFIEDFILYGTSNKTRFDIPDLILNTTAPVKELSEADFLWEKEKMKQVFEVKTDIVTEEQVAKDTSYIRLWFDILLNKDKSEILSDLEEYYDSEDHKKQVFWLWNKINTKYDQEKENEGKKPPF